MPRCVNAGAAPYYNPIRRAAPRESAGSAPISVASTSHLQKIRQRRDARNPLARRALVALGFAMAFASPLAVVLSRTIPATAQRQLAEAAAGDQSVPVELPRAAVQSLAGISYLHRVRLETRNIGQIADRSEIRLLVATHGTSPSLDAGELAISGTECTYRTVRGARFPNNEYVTFRRGRGCAPLHGTPTGELRLTLRFSTAGRAALWTYTPSPGAAISHDAILIADPVLPQSYARPIVRGVLVDTYPANSARRVDLLAYVWQVSGSSRWIWIALAGSATLVWCAALCFQRGAADVNDRPRPDAARAAAGAFCAAAGLSVMYAVLVPPFQAADEPNHFITFATVIGRPALANEATAWAELSHFERIQFHPDERFGPADRDRRGITWNDGVAQDTIRGAGILWLWRAVSVVVGTLPIAHLLLALRLINTLLFASTVACYVLLVAWITGTRHPELWVVPLFLVPTLPFFASYVSNYSLLVDAYIVLAAGAIVLSCGRPRASIAGPLIAGSWIVAALVSRSAVPLAPMIAALLLARLVMGAQQRPVLSAAVFWSGVGLAIAAGLKLAAVTYAQAIGTVADRLLRSSIASLISAAVQDPWLAVLPAAAAVGAEVMIAALLRRAGPRRVDGCRTLVRLAAGGAAAAMVLLLAASFVIDVPRLYPVDPLSPPPPLVYAKAATRAGLTMFRFGRPDLLMSVTFWGGFGWLDTLLPDAAVAALAGATGVAFAALFFWTARVRSIRTMILVCCVVLGYAAALAAYAVSVSRTTPADLHGRYLIGLYLLVVTLAWTALPRAVDAAWINRRIAVTAGGMACLGIHAYSLAMILQRYF